MIKAVTSLLLKRRLEDEKEVQYSSTVSSGAIEAT